ncbi:MAG: chemotaxis protein CheW [Betaproteobacteria bacterium]|jgi:purine-binding chemotaxis protein CheW|nr:chemotaxis protein CheW [Betaproteobacteria bacterium]
MSTSIVRKEGLRSSSTLPSSTRDIDDVQTMVTMTVGQHLFGIPIHDVRDIFIPENVFAVPLAPPTVVGLINLRGRIVTVFDVAVRLGISTNRLDQKRKKMCVTIEQDGEHYGLLVDQIGDIVEVRESMFAGLPSHTNALWHQLATGVYKLDHNLLVALDVNEVLENEQPYLMLDQAA